MHSLTNHDLDEFSRFQVIAKTLHVAHDNRAPMCVVLTSACPTACLPFAQVEVRERANECVCSRIRVRATFSASIQAEVGYVRACVWIRTCVRACLCTRARSLA
eukprot:5354042-Pleurochrysis_carterae.AAC.1